MSVVVPGGNEVDPDGSSAATNWLLANTTFVVAGLSTTVAPPELTICAVITAVAPLVTRGGETASPAADARLAGVTTVTPSPDPAVGTRVVKGVPFSVPDTFSTTS